MKERWQVINVHVKALMVAGRVKLVCANSRAHPRPFMSKDFLFLGRLGAKSELFISF